MLNPDGVIVGNYRCSLTGKDMNRNFRHPRKQSFPILYHMKEIILKLQKEQREV
jgi:murein tripeptide amidase MpaA